MAFDHLILFLWLSLTGSGLVAASPSQSWTVAPQPRETNQIISPSPLVATTNSQSLLLAQENSNSNGNGGNSYSFPKALIILGVGGLIITGGAVFILIRLLATPDLDQESYETTQPQPDPEIYPASPQTLIQFPAIEAPPEADPPIAQNGLINLPPTPVTEPATEAPPEADPPIAQNGLINLPPTPVTETATEAPPEPSAPTEPTLVAESPQPVKIDRIEELILQLQYPNPNHRSKAIWELAQQGDSRAIEPLVNLLFTSDSKQRSKILAALAEISTRCIKPMSRALVFALQDENPEVRQNAIRDLTRIYDLMYQTSQILQRAMDDPEPDVRETAQWAADKLSRMRPLPISRNHLDNG
ncbi:MAG: HEAT repeat domain-containing protein [Arthrospira sp. SH-MAG29]|nr:HEAT repeat domain-containing protein [Arthrospira sp. SH-MAG29]MBS0017233.1 HEAT repeat domain-containing protein [Arthrospira sp. SH-MAG29]